jgi:hypothetical protein
MPSTSKKQHNFMAAVAKNPTFAKKVGIKSSVGEEFIKADKGRKFGSGGTTRPDVQKVNKPKTQHGKMALFKEGGEMKQVDMKKNPGMAKLPTAVRNKMGYMKKGGMAEGGKSDMMQDKAMIKKAFKQHDMQEHKGGKGTSLKLKNGGMAASKMGSVKTAAPSINGVATKGKTKGTMVTMKRGGKTC